MPVHNFTPLSGKLESFVITSKSLKNNTLNDPFQREVVVYLPLYSLSNHRQH